MSGAPMAVRIATFNANGIRALSRYVARHHRLSLNGFLLQTLGVDILCVQETRASAEAMAELAHLRDYAVFSAHNAQRRGYCGVATFVRRTLCCRGAAEVLAQGSGRALETDHGAFSVLNAYFPHFDNGDTRQRDYDARKASALGFYAAAAKHVAGRRDLIVCGDFNAVYAVRDHHQFARELQRIRGREPWGDGPRRRPRPRPGPTELPHEFLDAEELEKFLFETPQRAWLRELLDGGGYVDSFRLHSDAEGAYSCWNPVLGLRRWNLGTRVDLVLVPAGMRVAGAGLLPEIGGSDHCPAYADVDVEAPAGDGALRRSGNLHAFFKRSPSP